MGTISLTVAVLGGVLFALIREKHDPLKIFVVAVAVLTVGGVLSVNDAFSGFSNTGILTVAVLFALTGSLQQSVLFEHLTRFDHLSPGRFKPWLLFGSVSALSALLNNTPLVAMMMPVANRIAQRARIRVATLLMPISFLAMLGGTLTLVGTSTNLISSGLMEKMGYRPIGFFEMTPVALPMTLVGLLTIGLTYKRLPTRTPSLAETKGNTAHWVRFIVQSPSSIIGKTIEAAQLRALHGVYLFGIERQGHLYCPVTPTDRIEANDCLIFTGQIEKIDELKRIDHLILETDALMDSDYFNQANTLLIEAVVTGHLGAPNETIKTIRFRDRYHAVVIGIVRHGRQLNTKPGAVVPVPGDRLLMIAQRDSLQALHDETSLMILNQSARKATPSSMKDSLPFIAYLAAITLSIGLGINLLITSLAALALLLITDTMTVTQAMNAMNIKLILTIALSFALGEALTRSGTASALANALAPRLGEWPIEGLLILSSLIPVIMTNVVTNNAAAILSLPVVAAIITQTPYNPRPFLLLATIVSSCAFLSPYGYQTNTMVAAVASYRFSDFIRYGFPLTLITVGVAIVSIRLMYF